MILREYERFVVECEFVVAMTPKEAPYVSLKESCGYLVEYINSGHALYKMLNDRVSVRAKKAVDNGDSITILFIYNDKDAADPSFSNESTGSVRTEKKLKGEGIAVSAHLTVMKYPVSKKLKNSYPALLEEVPGLNRRSIGAALTNFFKEATDYEWKSPTSKAILHPRQLITLDAYSSHNLDELMKTGKLRGFTAVQSSVNERLDEDGETPIIVKERTMKIAVGSLMGNKAVAAIEQVKKKVFGQEYSKLRVSYTDNNGRNKSLELDTREEDSLSKGYSKVVKIDLTVPIGQCEKAIHKTLNEKMLDYLDSMGCYKDDIG